MDFLRYTVASIKRHWYEKLPEEAMMGDKGKVVVHLKIHKDGTFADPGPTIEISSGRKPFDKAALEGVQASAPLGHVPESSSRPDIELLITFFYNLPPSAPHR